MAYSPEARSRRRCSYVYPEGHPKGGFRCLAYALWDSPGALEGRGLCAGHGARTRGIDRPRGEPYECRTVALCRCVAYAWPHRPSGGLCRWPHPPLYRLTLPAGTHAEFRRPRWYVNDGRPTVRRVVEVGAPGR